MINVENKIIRESLASAPAGWSTRLGTLARELYLEGHGLHTGRRVSVRILPVASERQDQGIVFRRLRSGRLLGELPARPEAWCKQPLCTTLRSKSGMKIRTTEHLMAALLMCEIDSATVELDAEEVPILYGGAAQWVRAIRECGRADLPAAKRFIKVLHQFVVECPDSPSYAISPAQGYMLETDIRPDDFPTNRWKGLLTPATFPIELAAARSYGHLRWAVPAILAGYLTGKPILRGAMSACLAVIARRRVLGGMLFPNEFARHRALDLVGDFALAGAPLLACVKASKPVHERNNIVIKKLLEAQDKWAWIEFGDTAATGGGKETL